MFLKVFIFLFLAAECRGNIFCNFKKDLCRWSNAYPCHYQHETKIPLAGKTGYLQISKNTCNLAAISISMNSEARFRLNYFLNGTDRANIYIYAEYGLTSRSIIWQCTANQGPKWNRAEIYIPSSFFNSLNKVIIETNIAGDATIAIGNIDQPKNGHIQYRCPPSPPIIKPTTKTPRVKTTKISKIKTTKIPRVKTTKISKIKTTKIPRVKTTKPTTPLVNTDNTQTMCNFTLNLCQWRDIYQKCHFKHVKNTPLLGETGYLMLSKDTCKHATLLVKLKEFKFQLHYLMNGTGNMSLSIGVHYGFAGRYPIWTCSTSQGPKWHKVDITVQLIHFDPRVNIYIDAAVSGDATVAIGNIAKAGDGSTEKQCQSSSGNRTTSLEFSTTREILPEDSTPMFISNSIKHDSIMTTKSHFKPTITTDLRQNINDGKTDSNINNNNGKTNGLTQQLHHKFKRGAVIGGSVMGAILVVVLAVFSIFMFKRNRRMWNVQKATNNEIETPYKSFENQSVN